MSFNGDPVTCLFHPDQPAAAFCQKYGKGRCLDCLENDPRCPDPEIYCKFREQCVIFFHLKEKRRQERHEREGIAHGR